MELLEPIIVEINPKAYEVIMIEIGVELSDIYLAMFDVIHSDYINRGVQPKKAEASFMNSYGLKSIENSTKVKEIILKKEEKYDYAQAMLNLTLSTARIYSKLYEKDK